MKRKGCSILFINDRDEVLLFLRDDIDTIPYPNMWDLPGGHVEPGETPRECIVREMKEEMDLHLHSFDVASVMEFDDRIEHTFWKRANLHIPSINLMEGQYLKWFTRTQVRETNLAYGFNEIVEDFFERALYKTET